MMTPGEIAGCVVSTLDGKKARDIKLLRTREVTILADYFVICTATSTTQLKTLSDEVEGYSRKKARRRCGAKATGRAVGC